MMASLALPVLFRIGFDVVGFHGRKLATLIEFRGTARQGDWLIWSVGSRRSKAVVQVSAEWMWEGIVKCVFDVSRVRWIVDARRKVGELEAGRGWPRARVWSEEW
jgi:hypothetical protein